MPNHLYVGSTYLFELIVLCATNRSFQSQNWDEARPHSVSLSHEFDMVFIALVNYVPFHFSRAHFYALENQNGQLGGSSYEIKESRQHFRYSDLDVVELLVNYKNEGRLYQG